jgi:hypothetical protein
LFHPHADFWADHHSTTFLTASARHVFEESGKRNFIFDERAESCAELLWRHLSDAFGYRNPRYEELVAWAGRTDAARYASVHEAIEASAPALQINASLAYSDGTNYCRELVKQLQSKPLEAVAALPEVQSRYGQFRRELSVGLRRFRASARLDRSVVTFDVDARDTAVPRYAPFYFFPEALYSAGILRREGATVVTAMRNPWKDFAHEPLGKIFEKVGGGGHPRIGSVLLRGDAASRATWILGQLISEIRRSTVAVTTGPGVFSD